MGILFILVYVVIVLTVIEINVILFTLTGLDKNISRFQVISMLTGTGFTTGESELIIEHPLRRRLGAFLILFGAFSLAVVISAITNILSNRFRTLEIGFIAVGLIIIVMVLKIRSLRSFLSEKMRKDLEKKYKIADLPISEVLFTDEEDDLVSVIVSEQSSLINKKLIDILDEDEDILVLVIQRGEVKFRKNRYEKKLVEGDVIYLYGSSEEIRKRFNDEKVKV
jgi:hypothetical protein